MLTKMLQLMIGSSVFFLRCGRLNGFGSVPYVKTGKENMSSYKQTRVRQFVFTFYMSGIMSLLMSGIITLINTGLTDGFFHRWGAAFAVAWAVAFPLVSFIAPMAGKMADWTMARLFSKERRPD